MQFSTALSLKMAKTGLSSLANADSVLDKGRAAPLVEQWKRPLTSTACKGSGQ
jgi:hypothetical protein